MKIKIEILASEKDIDGTGATLLQTEVTIHKMRRQRMFAALIQVIKDYALEEKPEIKIRSIL